MATELYTGSASISTTEYSLTNNSTTLTSKTDNGPVQAFIDLNALAAGDEFEFKVYEKVQSGGTQRLVWRASFVGAQSEAIAVIPALITLYGWEMTLKKIAGTDRTIAWSLRKP